MISIRRLCKAFSVTHGKVEALKSLDLEVAEGEFFVIVGASGSGKTTLLRCVAGLESPDNGEIRIAGRPVFSDTPPTWIPPQERNFGMVFQSYAVWPHLTVFDNVALPLREGAQKIPRSQVNERVRQALRMVQLDEQSDRSATLLSGGQQQRVALARAIAVNPRVLLMDEPFAALDAQTREFMQAELLKIWTQAKKTVLFITHQINEAVYLADRVVVMTRRPGRIREIVDVAPVRKAEGWDRFDRTEEVMDQESFVHLRTHIWRMLRGEQQTDDPKTLETTGGMT